MSSQENGAPTPGDGLLEGIPEPDYDHLASPFLTEEDGGSSSDEDSLGKPKPKKNGKNGKKSLNSSPPDPEYILGTLVVRVVAARDLEPAHNHPNLGDFLFGGGGKRGGTANPYASVKFGASAQRTSESYDTLNPTWPRGETMFMDVSLPVSKITHPDIKVAQEKPAANPATSVLLTENIGEAPHDATCDEDHPVVEPPYSDQGDPDGTPLPDIRAASTANSSSSNYSSDSSHAQNNHKDCVGSLDVPEPILTVAVFSASEMGKAHKALFTDNAKYPSKKEATSGDSDDDFLGMASVDLTQLLTGKKALVDAWLPLAGGGRGSVRVVCEYEASDVAPSRGDFVRFTRFCHPADLHPLAPGRQYPVQEVLDNDNLLLTYTTPEGWVCSFVVHRFMIICAEKHHNAVRVAQDEWHAFTERLSHSPLVGNLTETVERLPEEGLFAVGADAFQGGASLLGRWLEGGLGTAVKDVAFATNWDGQFTAENRVERHRTSQPTATGAGHDDANETIISSSSLSNIEEEVDTPSLDTKPSSLSLDPVEEPSSAKSTLPNMPSCPITGEPMAEPVVAADGHTYEREAIARWLRESDKSPLTGSVLPHKELVPNYGLISSLQEQAESVLKAPPSSSSSNAADKQVKDGKSKDDTQDPDPTEELEEASLEIKGDEETA